MNLVEVVLAGILLTVSAGSSLQIWSLVSLGVAQEERRQQLAERLEGELVGLEAQLRSQGRRMLPASICGASAATLQALLAARTPVAGVQRQLRLLPEEDGLLVELTAEEIPLRRQRLYVPAALGLCVPAVPLTEPEASPDHG
jgi:hypothetical protein